MENQDTLLRNLEHPVAIAMWDFSWLLRHYDGGGFEDWDKALDELTERGYNAIRIDVFPHLTACDDREEFFFPYSPETCSIWHHGQDVTVNVRAALKEFLPKCFERGIYIGLSTWIQWPAQRPLLLNKFDFVKAWEKTLEFLKENGLLRNTLYVDFLNEYPYYHGFSSLKRAAMNKDGKNFPISESNMQEDVGDRFRKKGREYLRDFSAEVIDYFSEHWHGIDFAFSISANIDGFHPERSSDFSKFGFFDMHIWFVHYAPWYYYQSKVSSLKNREDEKALFEKIEKAWGRDKRRLVKWMDKRMKSYYRWSEKYHTPVGNTEGWGFIFWVTDTDDWTFNKRAAEICVDLAIKYNYSFICTTNYTHPHFRKLWDDVQWHQKITSKIKQANIKKYC